MEPNPCFWAGKRVCVTGGTGLLGFQLVERLLRLGARVRILALPPEADHPIFERPAVVKVFGDVRDPLVVRSAVAGCDVVFHTAGVVTVWRSDREQMRQVHVEGTRQVLRQTSPEARIVHTSSSMTIGATTGPEPIDEDRPFGLHHLPVAYVHAKRASEREALDAAARGRDVVVTNPGYLLGPHDHSRSIMGRFCIRFWKGRVLLVPPGGLSLVDVRDVARGHLLAAEHGVAGRRYVLGGENLTFRDFIGLLADVGGLKPRATPCLSWWTMSAVAGLSECRARMARREPYPSFQHVWMSRYYWFYSSQRAADELGYRFRPLADCLHDTYRWYASAGALGLRGLNRWWMRPAGPLDRAA